MLTIILFLTALILYLFFHFKQKYGYWARKGIKGPFPFFGTFLAEFGRDGREVEKHYQKTYGDVFGTYTANGQRIFNTCVPAHIKQVQRDIATFQNFGLFFVTDSFMHKSIFFQNGAKWKAHRSAMTHLFTSRKLKSLLSQFESSANSFVDKIEWLRARDKTDVFELREMCKLFAVDNASKAIFSLDVDSFKADQQNSEFAKLALRVGDVNTLNILLISLVPKFIWQFFNLNIVDIEPLDKLGNLFKKLVRERDPKARFNDLVELLQIRDGKLKMSEDEVIGNCLLSFFAGSDATSNALTKCFYFLCTESEVRERLTEELRRDFKDGITYERLVEQPYLDAFVNETLRLAQSMLILDRMVTRDTQLGEHRLEKGTIIHLIPYLNHNSDKFFPNAEKFDVNRFLDKSSSNENQINRNDIYMPFSAGPRQCIGFRLAILELKYLIARVLLEYDLFKPQDFKLEELSRRRFVQVVRLTVGLRKRAK